MNGVFKLLVQQVFVPEPRQFVLCTLLLCYTLLLCSTPVLHSLSMCYCYYIILTIK